MKYLALALALLLAVGSHAAPATDNVPPELVEFRENMAQALTKARESFDVALTRIENEELRGQLSQYAGELFNYIKLAQHKAEPLTNAVVSTVMGATAELRAGIQDDFDNLKSSIQADYNKLEQVLEKHIEDYRGVLSSQVDISGLENLKAKVHSLVDSLRSKFEVNVDETKTALQPILETIRAKLDERIVTAKTVAGPYIEEYRDKVTGYASEVASKAQSIDTQDFVGLQGKVVPLATEIFAKLQELGGVVSENFNKQ